MTEVVFNLFMNNLETATNSSNWTHLWRWSVRADCPTQTVCIHFNVPGGTLLLSVNRMYIRGSAAMFYGSANHVTVEPWGWPLVSLLVSQVVFSFTVGYLPHHWNVSEPAHWYLDELSHSLSPTVFSVGFLSSFLSIMSCLSCQPVTQASVYRREPQILFPSGLVFSCVAWLFFCDVLLDGRKKPTNQQIPTTVALHFYP